MLRLSKNRVGRVRPGGVEAGPVAALVVILFGLLLATNGGSGPTVAQAVMPTDAPPFPNGWVWQNPLPQGFDLYGVTCPTDQGCYAVGISGTVVASSPATGGHWQTQSSGTTQNLTNVDCVSAGVCVAVGTGGTIRRTTNAGQSWSPAPITTTANLGVLNCLPDGTCYTYDTNGNLFKSSDSGASWASTYYTSSTPTGLSCPDAANCYLLSGGGFSKTTDGGQTWATTPITYSTNQNSSNFYFSVSCPAINTCYLLKAPSNPKGLGRPVDGSPQVLKTIDGGQTWKGFLPVYGSFPGAGVGLFKIVCLNIDMCYGLTVNHTFYITTDGGNSWSPRYASVGYIGNYGNPYDFTCLKSNLLKCYTAGSTGLIYKSADGGQTWQYDLDGLKGKELEDVSCPDTTTCFSNDLEDSYTDANNNVTNTLSLAHTTDSGTHWITSSNLTLYNNMLGSLNCPNRLICYTSSSNGPVYKTADGGQSWISYTTGVTNPIKSWACPAVSVCYGQIDGGRVLKTADGGLHWSTQTVSSTAQLEGLSCPELNVCYTGGQSVFKTSDGGQSWIYLTQTVTGSAWLHSLNCPTSAICYGVAYTSGFCSITYPPTVSCIRIQKTTDGGSSWTTINFTYGLFFNSIIACPDPLNCYVSSGGGDGVKHTTDGAATWNNDTFCPFYTAYIYSYELSAYLYCCRG